MARVVSTAQAARAVADADTRPPRRRSTKTRRGTASGMYGNAAPPRDRYRSQRCTRALTIRRRSETGLDWPERASGP